MTKKNIFPPLLQKERKYNICHDSLYLRIIIFFKSENRFHIGSNPRRKNGGGERGRGVCMVFSRRGPTILNCILHIWTVRSRWILYDETAKQWWNYYEHDRNVWEMERSDWCGRKRVRNTALWLVEANTFRVAYLQTFGWLWSSNITRHTYSHVN